MQEDQDIVSTCAQVTVYSGDICRNELLSLITCFSGVTSPPPALNIPSSIDQETGESDAMSLVNGLSFLNPSQQCQEAIIPFLCISIFNLCDSSNTLHTALREDCLHIRDDVCVSEWSTAVELLGADVLPVCEELPYNITVECTGKWNFSLHNSLGTQIIRGGVHKVLLYSKLSKKVYNLSTLRYNYTVHAKLKFPFRIKFCRTLVVFSVT